MDDNNMNMENTGVAEAVETVAEAAEAAETTAETAAEAVTAETAAPLNLTRREKKQLKKAQKKEKKIQKKIAKKERKLRWKETKKEDRRKLKEHYKDAPWYIRIPRLALRPMAKISFWVLVAAVVVAIGFAINSVAPFLQVVFAYIHKDDEVTREQIEMLSPYDTEGAARIAAMPSIDPDETWTICIYMVGADLEDYDEIDLSTTTKMQIVNERNARKQAALDQGFNQLKTYADDLSKNNLPLPEFLYYPEKTVA